MATYFETFSAQVRKATTSVRQVASGVAEGASARAAVAVSLAQDTKAAAVAQARAALDLAVNTATGMRQRGLRACSLEAVLALRVAAVAQAKMLEATSRKALADAVMTTRQGAQLAQDKTCELTAASRALISQKSFQATAGSAVSGAVAIGAGGGATGLAAGGVMGAIAGLPLAVFTFGLSIPVGAAIGGGTGLVAGVTAGATAGAVGGGAAGYGVYAKKDEIKGAAMYVACKAGEGASRVKGAAHQSLEYTKGAASAARARVSGHGKAEKIDIRGN